MAIAMFESVNHYFRKRPRFWMRHDQHIWNIDESAETRFSRVQIDEFLDLHCSGDFGGGVSNAEADANVRAIFLRRFGIGSFIISKYPVNEMDYRDTGTLWVVTEPSGKSSTVLFTLDSE